MGSIIPIHQSHSSKRGFTLRLFAAAFVISLLTTIFSGWQSWQMHSRYEEILSKHIDYAEDVGRIMLFDEVLTMSARMAAATGDFSYEKRYDEFDLKLTASIDDLRADFPQAEIARFVNETDEANLALIKMERQAFAWAHQGKQQEATALLTSAEYVRLKKIYADGMKKSAHVTNDLIEKETRHLHLLFFWLMTVSAVGVLVLLATWLFAVRSARSWAAERREAEDARHHLLEQVSRGKDEFLAAISHELKTPLNHILGFADLLKEGLAGELNAEQKGMAQDIFDAGSKQLAIVNSLIELARLQTGKTELQAELQDPARMLGEIATRHAAKAQVSGLAFAVELAKGLGEMPLDREVVAHLLDQLLANAFKFTPSGGKVSLTARRVPRTDVAAPVRIEADEYLELAVADNGPGVAPEILPRLFQPFVQGDGRLARSHQGTGIGLMMVKLLAELHGGGSGVESEPGTGAKFLVWLPIDKQQQ
ncbi:MAG: HAMP domain-containing sensor histidine kinase [Gallionella sp.]|nr:HAMP domain-containing sensor histidine kinase [Gallionella sp.]